MVANDFISMIRADLQEKSEHWKPEELFVKLQRSYTSLQNDLPFFIANETLEIKKDTDIYYLKHEPVENISCFLDAKALTFSELENFYIKRDAERYSFDENKLLINRRTSKDGICEISYKYIQELESINCEISIPAKYLKALRYLHLSDVYEKPTRNSKERNLSAYYINLYDKELHNLKINKRLRPTGVRSRYQII